MLISPTTGGILQGILLPLYSVMPYEANIVRKMLGCWALISRAIVPTV